MKQLKTGDLILQLLVILVIIIGACLDGSTLLSGLFILGFVQIVSVIVHLFYRHESWISKLRVVYFWLLLLPVGGFIYALVPEAEDKYDMRGLEVMLFVALFSYLLGIFYFIVTIIEWRRLRKTN